MVVDSRAWSQEMWGSSELGDERRTKRLVDVGARLARQAGASLARCCEGDDAAIQGSYRLMGNDKVDPEAIAQAGFGRVAEQAQQHEGVLLAVQDTTSVSYKHAVAPQLGSVGGVEQPRCRGYLVHSTLLIQADSEQTVGLIDQQRWCRKDEAYGQKHERKRRAYEDKESYKWEQASQRTQARLGEIMARTITVADRESDVYEYLQYMLEHGHRFVIRAQGNRTLVSSESSLFEVLSEEQPRLYETTVSVAQRGGRSARKATVRVRACEVKLAAPQNRGKDHPVLTVNVVRVYEEAAPAGQEPLNWIVLTSEAVGTAEQVRRVVRYYELRWRIEEFHKAWKSGVGVERVRMQSPGGLERMLVITAFVAVRLLQLREPLSRPDADDPGSSRSCGSVLDVDQWQVLWQLDQRSPPPSSPPPARWACLAIAKLGGFTDTKRTGRPGWDTLWHGWLRLQERVEGFRLAKQMLKM